MIRGNVAGLVLTLLALGACAAAGCGGGPATLRARELKSVSLTPPSPVERADAVELWAVPPAAINWDETPGPDGVQVRVFLYMAEQAETVLVKGTVECLLYDGRVPRENLSVAKPMRVWTFTTQDLATRHLRGMAGWGYALQLGWGRNVPAASVVTVAARYVPPAGEPVYSAPISIAMPSAVRSGPSSTRLGGDPGYSPPHVTEKTVTPTVTRPADAASGDSPPRVPGAGPVTPGSPPTPPRAINPPPAGR